MGSGDGLRVGADTYLSSISSSQRASSPTQGSLLYEALYILKYYCVVRDGTS